MMRLLALLLYAISVVNGSLDGRIVGGKNASEGNYPYVVRIMYDGIMLCGGTIINNNYILTAAQCTFGLEKKHMTVVAGTNVLNGIGVSYSVEELHSHSQFRMKHFYNDIGLIRVAEKIIFNDRIQPVTLNPGFSTGSDVVLVGWGHNIEGTDKDADVLQEVIARVANLSECWKTYPTMTANNICTFAEAGKGLCYGDAGGPLLWNGAQIGILSTSHTCGLGDPDIHTRVSKYMDFITSIVNSAGSQMYLNAWIIFSFAMLTFLSYSHLLS